MNQTGIEAAFHNAMVNICKRASEECDYTPTIFISMLSKHGGLLAANSAQYGFNRLWKCGRLDLTVEAHVLKPEFAPLFTPEERRRARDRLQQHGYCDVTA